ncbi:DMT family transporter [Alginatibacterium sediminis]|uniref:DMT family transporter n=1 Tax=Alginatibacterium sediminis TaxID=2164068 RepID=A0A420EB71_9ALTE|nr:DMT family transporter [Alginatibacterium sediminis]RKF17930.1 DMT family transporter [Alginatibacterium sediminis]
MDQVKGRAELYLLLATMLAAVGWIASKLVIQEMPSDVFIAARFLLASLVLLPFCYRDIIKLRLTQIAAVSAVGVFLAGSLLTWIHAVSISTSLSEGAFIMSLAMIIAPITAWLLFQNKPKKAFWIALPLSVLGMALLALSNGWQVDLSQWYFLLASSLLSVHFVLNKRVIRNIKPLSSICIQLFIVGIAGVIAASFVTNEPFEITSHLIFWFSVSTLVATALRYLLQTLGQHSVNMETASLIMILEPIWTLLLSVVVLAEVIQLQKLIGGGIILLSLTVYIKLSKRSAKLN